jgi:hypothetical protein
MQHFETLVASDGVSVVIRNSGSNLKMIAFHFTPQGGAVHVKLPGGLVALPTVPLERFKNPIFF